MKLWRDALKDTAKALLVVAAFMVLVYLVGVVGIPYR